jgi:hypothetical protein
MDKVKKSIIAVVLSVGTGITALTLLGTSDNTDKQIKSDEVLGDIRVVELEGIHRILTEWGGSGLRAISDTHNPKDSISVEELHSLIGRLGLSEEEFNQLIEEYFYVESNVSYATDTRNVFLGDIHKILVDKGGDGLKPVSKVYSASDTITVAQLWEVNNLIGLSETEFMELLVEYFEEEETEEIEGTEEIEETEWGEVPEDFKAEGQVDSNEFILVLFELQGVDLNDLISDMPDNIELSEFHGLAPLLGMSEQEVFNIQNTLKARGLILDGEEIDEEDTSEAIMHNDGEVGSIFGSVEDEPTSKMSTWVVDAFARFEGSLPEQFNDLIRHNPRGAVTGVEINSVVIAMYELAGVPTDQAPQWPRESVLRGEAIQVLVDAYINILTFKGGDPLTLITEVPAMSHFEDYEDITSDMHMNIAIALYNGWVTGVSDTRLGVLDTFDRQQVLAIAHRMFNTLEI